MYVFPGALWVALGHLPPIPQHPRTPGHKAFRLQLTANELSGLMFAGVGPEWFTIQPRSARANPLWQPRAGVGPKWFTTQPRSARANPLWQPRALGIWGRYLPTKIPHLSGTLDNKLVCQNLWYFMFSDRSFKQKTKTSYTYVYVAGWRTDWVGCEILEHRLLLWKT